MKYNVLREDSYTPPPRREITMAETRVCPRCHVEKPLTTEFWHLQNRLKHSQGYQVYCIPCKREINIERYHNLPKEDPTEDPTILKVCTQCKVGKPLTREHWTSNGYGWSSHCKKCSRRRINSYRNDSRIKVLTHYSQGLPQCSCCGETNLVFLAIDHINDDGAKHRREVVSGRELPVWLIKNNFPEGFRVLCHNCNWAFHQLGYCPHHSPT
jgi:hypothetical protein